MVETIARPDAGLAELLTARARRAGTRRLVLDVAGGLVAATVVALWRPALWPALLCAALCFASFGVWGLADRRLAQLAPAEVDATADLEAAVLELARGGAALVGTLAAVGLAAATLFGLMGRSFIS